MRDDIYTDLSNLSFDTQLTWNSADSQEKCVVDLKDPAFEVRRLPRIAYENPERVATPQHEASVRRPLPDAVANPILGATE